MRRMEEKANVKANRIAHMTRYLPEKMRDVRDGRLNEVELSMLREMLIEEKTFFENCEEDICKHLHRESRGKKVKVPVLKTAEEAINFYYLEGLEAQDFMFVEEFYMYANYKQQRPSRMKEKLNIGIGLLQACIYDLAYAISEVDFHKLELEKITS